MILKILLDFSFQIRPSKFGGSFNGIGMARNMGFFSSAIDGLKTVITAIGAGIGVWGVINLLEGYGNDNAGSKSQGIKQLMAGGGIIILAQTVIPLLSGLFRRPKGRLPA